MSQALENARFSKDRSIWSATVAGGLLLFSSTVVFVQLQSALNKVWGASLKELELAMWKKLLLVRGRSLALVLVIGFLLMVSLAGSAALAMLESTLTEKWPGLSEWMSIGYDLFSLFVVGALFFLLFRLLPDTKVDTRAAWIGGLLTSLLLASGKWGIGLYFSKTAVGSAYGRGGIAGGLPAVGLFFDADVFLRGGIHACAERGSAEKRKSEVGGKRRHGYSYELVTVDQWWRSRAASLRHLVSCHW